MIQLSGLVETLTNGLALPHLKHGGQCYNTHIGLAERKEIVYKEKQVKDVVPYRKNNSLQASVEWCQPISPSAQLEWPFSPYFLSVYDNPTASSNLALRYDNQFS